MEFAIGVYHTRLGIVAHPGSAHVVPAAAGRVGPGVVVGVSQIVHQLDAADIVDADLLADQFVEGAHTVFFEGGEHPVELGPGHAEGVAVGA